MLGTLDELAGKVGGRVIGDGSVSVARVSSIDDTGADALAFAVDEKYLAAALASKAAAVLVDAGVPLPAQPTKPLIVVENARHALAAFLATLKTPRPRGPYRHATAVVEDGARVGEAVYLGAHSYVGKDAKIGNGCTLGAGAF